MERPVAKPGYPFVGVGERGIENHGAFRRQYDLQSCNVFKIKTKDPQPVRDSVGGNATQSEDLMNTRPEGSGAKIVIEIVREKVWGRRAVQCNRLLGCSIQSESLAREDGLDFSCDCGAC